MADIQFHGGAFVQRVQAPGKQQLDSGEGLRLDSNSRLLRLVACIFLFLPSGVITHSQSLSRHSPFSLPVNPSRSQELLKTHPSLHFSLLPSSDISPLILILTFKALPPPAASTAQPIPPHPPPHITPSSFSSSSPLGMSLTQRRVPGRSHRSQRAIP